MNAIEKLFLKEKELKKFKDTVSGITLVASDTKKLIRFASDGNINAYCIALQNYQIRFSRDYSIVLLIFSLLIVAATALIKYVEENKELPFDTFHRKVYGLVYRTVNEDKHSFEQLCTYVGKGDGENIAMILTKKLIPYRKLLQLFSRGKYGKDDGDPLINRIKDIKPWKINKNNVEQKLIPFVKKVLGTEFSSRIRSGMSSAKRGIDEDSDKKIPAGEPEKREPKPEEEVPAEEPKKRDLKPEEEVPAEGPKKREPKSERKLSEETKMHIVHANEIMKRRRKLLSEHKKSDGTPCNTTYEELRTLLEGDEEGEEDISSWVDANYPEWRDRMKNDDIHRKPGGLGGYENYALMNLAHSLRLAKAEGYDAEDPENNEIMVGKVPIDETKLETIEDEVAQKGRINKRLDKIIVEYEDILRSAQKHFDELGLRYTKFGFLNAGDPYDPNGFLPNRGKALEEYLSMNTTLCRDLSHKRFRRKGGTAADAFYTRRDQHAFPPVVDFPERDIGSGRDVYDKKGAWDRLTGPGRDFYHERGIMSKNVYLTRSLGDCSANYREDRSFTWVEHETRFDDFEVDRTEGLGSKPFCILSIAGLEDRSSSLLRFGDDEGHTSEEYQKKWKEITMKQCEFVLRAFIKEQVKVLFLCAFGAGCFGGWASIVAACFRELLIRRGFINYFDKVVFPIGYDPDNYHAFREAFKKL